CLLPTAYCLFAVLALARCGAAAAAPAIRIMPPNNTTFLVDQRFDIRVEFTPTPGSDLTGISVSLDGELQEAALTALDTHHGLTLRGESAARAGTHTVTATAADSAGGETAQASVTLNVIDPVGSNRPVRNVIICLGDGMGAAHRTAARIVRYGVVEGRAQG